MNKILIFILPFLILGCSHKEFTKKENYLIKNNDSFVLINPFKDPLNLVDVFATVFKDLNLKISIAHKHIINKENQTTQGSGFFINQEATIVTNNHVVKNQKYLEIKTDDKKIFLAQVIYKDIKNDIAILKPVKSFFTKYWFDISNKKTILGKEINVLGYPLMDILGSEVRITQGIISSKKGIKNDETQFQISAAIQPGNSGGPIIDENFIVLGIATSRLSDKYLLNYLSIVPQNINFGVKSTYIISLLKINNQYNFNKNHSIVHSLEDAANATVLITTPKKNIPIIENDKLSSSLKIKYNYVYHWEFDSISYLEILILTKNNKEIIKGIYSGDSLSSPRNITKELLEDILNKATQK